MATQDNTSNQELSGFKDRLLHAFNSKGITDPKQRVDTIVRICGVTPRTAEKYLKADKCPIQAAEPLMGLAEALGVRFDWLFDGGILTKSLIAKNKPSEVNSRGMFEISNDDHLQISVLLERMTGIIDLLYMSACNKNSDEETPMEFTMSGVFDTLLSQTAEIHKLIRA